MGSDQSNLIWCIYYYIISKYKDVKYDFYADDTRLFVNISPRNATASLEQLNKCLVDVRYWMTSGELALNPEKNRVHSFSLKTAERKT